ncbi:MAG: precorrin-8X methylmutase, partial [Thermodesulfovibrionales bacterium]
MESIIIIGHGSPKKNANTMDIVGGLLHTAIHPGCTKDCVKAAYLEFAEPDIMGAITQCVEEGAKKIILHPYFLNSGMHVTKDIPETIDEARGLYPQVEMIYTEPLGIHNKLIQLTMERIRAAQGFLPGQIEERSMEIISEETALAGIPEERIPIVKRVIHATADFEIGQSLRFHPEAVKAGIEALKTGKDILTDVEMVKSGINKRLLSKWGGKVVC